MESVTPQPGSNDINSATNEQVVETKPSNTALTNEKGEETKVSINGSEENKGIEIGGKDIPMGEEVYNSTGASLGSSVINMMNTIVGAGTLSLPVTIMDGGIVGAGLMLILSLVLSLVGAHYLVVASAYTNEDSYGFIGRRLINKSTGYLADFFMILFDFGISVGYCNIVFSQTSDLIFNVFHISRETLSNHNWVSFLIIFNLSGFTFWRLYASYFLC